MILDIMTRLGELSCHILRSVCIQKGVNCEEFCMMDTEKRPCHEWVGKKSIKELLERENAKT